MKNLFKGFNLLLNDGKYNLKLIDENDETIFYSSLGKSLEAGEGNYMLFFWGEHKPTVVIVIKNQKICKSSTQFFNSEATIIVDRKAVFVREDGEDPVKFFVTKRQGKQCLVFAKNSKYNNEFPVE